jgi:hypothetical protein
MFQILILETRPTQNLPSPGGRGCRGGGIESSHPHLHPLPSREREIFFGFEYLYHFSLLKNEFQKPKKLKESP